MVRSELATGALAERLTRDPCAGIELVATGANFGRAAGLPAKSAIAISTRGTVRAGGIVACHGSSGATATVPTAPTPKIADSRHPLPRTRCRAQDQKEGWLRLSVSWLPAG